MRDQPAPLPFIRHSVVDQTANALRSALREGTLAEPLPGEQELAGRLGVSRPTLRAAFAILVREGLLAVAKGRRARIIAPTRPAPARTTQLSVCVVSPVPRGMIFPDEHPVLLQMHARFAAKGIAWDEIFDRRLAGPRPEARLRQLTTQHPHACWIMIASTAPMQRWFARSGLPALVLGTTHAGVRLPSIDINYRAVGWHAAGVALQHGHRQLALVMPAQPLAGDLACLAGMQAYVAQASPAATLLTISAGNDPAELHRKLDRALASAARPTVLFSLLQSHSLSILLHLLEHGHRVPGHVSLITRDLHPLLESARPDLAHYSRPTSQLVSRALRLTQALLSGRPVPAQPSLITPVFIPGRTLAAPAAAR